MQYRKLKIHFIKVGEGEHAQIETEDGYYLFTVEQCCDEGKRKFRLRARSLMEALERYKGPILTLSPKFC